MTTLKARKKKPKDTSLIPAEPKGESGLLRRDKDGLMLIQRMFLTEFALEGTLRKACRSLDIKERRVRGWLATEPAFQEAWDLQFGPGERDAVHKEMMHLTGEAMSVITDALEAERGLKKETSCPECGHKFTVEGARPDWRMRKAAAELVFRVTKIYTESKDIRVKGGMTVTHLTGDEHMALLALKAGKTVSEAVMARLREKGYIT